MTCLPGYQGRFEKKNSMKCHCGDKKCHWKGFSKMICDVDKKTLRDFNILEQFEALQTQSEQVAFIRYTFGEFEILVFQFFLT